MTAGARTNGGAGPNPYDKRIRDLGRPTLLTPEMTAQMETLIRGGALLAMLPGLMGVSKPAFYNWTKRGTRQLKRLAEMGESGAKPTVEDRKQDKIEAPYADFVDRLNMALAERDSANLSIIRKAAEGNPKIVRKVKKERELIGLDGEGRRLYGPLVEVEATETRTVEYDWRAAQYLLEKGNPAVFGPRSTLNIEKALPTDPGALADMDMGDLLALAAKLEAHLDGVSADDD